MNSELSAQIAEDVFEVGFSDNVVETIKYDEATIDLTRPRDIEQLIEVGAERHNFSVSRYMPYWATIWPVSRYLANFLLKWKWPESRCRVLELGCGLGLSGLAALKSGQHVTFSDYDLAALRYAKMNALNNGFAESQFEILALNWLAPCSGNFDFIIGSDLTFNQKLIPHLVGVFDAMLSRSGQIVLADQNRMRDLEFRELLRARGFTALRSDFSIDESLAWNASGSIYHIQRT